MKVLMVYYSRSGVTRKATETIAGMLRESYGVEVEVEEIVEGRDRGGFVAWLARIRDVVRRRPAAIEPPKADLAAYDLVAIGTPVWAWSASTPVRTFCASHGNKAEQVAFYCTMGGSGDKGAFKAMEELCGKTPVATLALIDRHVRKDDEEKFHAKVKAFAEEIVSVGG